MNTYIESHKFKEASSIKKTYNVFNCNRSWLIFASQSVFLKYNLYLVGGNSVG